MKPAFQSLLVTICLCSFVQAEAILQPLSLALGDQYRLAFVTSTKTTAESADIETYNAFVQATADAAPIGDWGLTWKAIGSTETVSARENTSTDTDDTSVPIFLLDGTELVPSYARLWDAERNLILRAFDVDEFSIAFNSPDPPILSVWTGTQADGFPRILPADLKVTGGPLGLRTHSVIGHGDASSNGWFNDTAIRNDLEARMYALSEILTAVPEPAGAFQFLVFFAFLSTLRERKPTYLGERQMEIYQRTRGSTSPSRFIGRVKVETPFRRLRRGEGCLRGLTLPWFDRLNGGQTPTLPLTREGKLAIAALLNTLTAGFSNERDTSCRVTTVGVFERSPGKCGPSLRGSTFGLSSALPHGHA